MKKALFWLVLMLGIPALSWASVISVNGTAIGVKHDNANVPDGIQINTGSLLQFDFSGLGFSSTYNPLVTFNFSYWETNDPGKWTLTGLGKTWTFTATQNALATSALTFPSYSVYANELGLTAVNSKVSFAFTYTPANGNAVKNVTMRIGNAVASFESPKTSAVPLPPAIWMLGVGLMSVLGIRRRK